MPKPTAQDKVDALVIVNAMIERYLASSSMYENDATVAEIKRIQKQLETRKQRLLNPQPKARKRKAQVSGADKVVMQYQDGDVLRTESYVNSKPKTGRQERDNG